ncbi:MAG TPA: PrsW family glutamic-type intramembrane protease [Candidatus Limnocylindria bacterium]|nr:PrsW family glutamic-type intramembrane protease [Candidatus Limnocylindria bacterium]
MTCRACGRDVPDGLFCSVCGADQRLGAGAGSRAGAGERFAAHPDEPVLQPGFLTTLLPHLDHDRVDEFRWAFFGGLGVVLVLWVAGLITAAIIVSAALIPVVYVLYLYEVRTYRDAPATVFGLTIGAGVVVGAVLTFLLNLIRPTVPAIQGSPFGTDIDLSGLLLTAVAIPIVQEIVKPLPALALRNRPAFGQTIDALVFGVAAGLGFAAAQTIVQFGGLLTSLEVRTEPGDWIYSLVAIAVFGPILHGSSTGIVTAALWNLGPRPGGLRVRAIAVALGSHVAFAAGSQLLAGFGFGLPVVLAWQGLVVAGVVVFVRYLLHAALIEEATAFGFERVTCPNCRETVTAGAFCPSCGMALAAATTRVHEPPSRTPEPHGRVLR